MDKTYLVCFVIFSLCFCNCRTNEDDSIAVISSTPLPDKSLSIGYQSMKGIPLPVAIQSRIISPRQPYNWILKGIADLTLRKRLNQNTTSSILSPTLTSNSYDTTTEERTRLIIRDKTKYQPTTTKVIIEDRHQCSSYEECQQKITNSHCVHQDGGRVCSCSSDYIKFEKKCLLRAQNGGRCNNSIQCMSRLSVCSMGYCKCPYGYKNMKEICIYVRPSRKQEDSFIWPLTISVIPVFFSLLFLAIWLVKGMHFRRRTLLAAHRSGFYEGRESPASENCFERTDKPPTYDEVVSTSTSTLTLSVQDLNQMPPPSYAVVQQAEQRINIDE